MSKLTEAKVIDIRARHAAGGVTQKQLAAEFGVCFQLISLIVNRKIWRHI
jgi:predicted transcriptional regulator